MNGWMNEWVNGNKWKYENKCKYENIQTKDWVNESLSDQMNDWMIIIIMSDWIMNEWKDLNFLKIKRAITKFLSEIIYPCL